MTPHFDDLTRLLHDSDPLAADPALASSDAARIRRMAIEAAQAAASTRTHAGTLALAASFLCVVVFALMTARKAAIDRAGGPPPPRPVAAMPLTQIHFSTPGGTRIIWTLDPSFDLKKGHQ